MSVTAAFPALSVTKVADTTVTCKSINYKIIKVLDRTVIMTPRL